MAQQISQQINHLYRRPTVEQITGKSRSSIYRDIKKKLFTKPVRIGANSVAWPSNEVDVITKARISGKTDDEIKKLVIELEVARGSA